MIPLLMTLFPIPKSTESTDNSDIPKSKPIPDTTDILTQPKLDVMVFKRKTFLIMSALQNLISYRGCN